MNIKKYELLHKNLGETPLEALERFRTSAIADAWAMNDIVQADFWRTVPLTYAGRLDPLAEGVLLVLIGDECKNKEAYLGLDKEYELDILCGASTDTHDLMGLVETATAEVLSYDQKELQVYVGAHTQEYPAYSSKTVGGIPLHVLSRTDALPENMPTKNIEIREIDLVDTNVIGVEELKKRIITTIDMVNGDFRQDEIKARWEQVLAEIEKEKPYFSVIKIRVVCSSGTYMRSLAHRIGKDKGVPACALGIKRTKIFMCDPVIPAQAGIQSH